MIAGVGLKLLADDGEPAAEVYSVATKENQARISWGDGKNIVRRSPGAGSIFKLRVSEIFHDESLSVWKPLGSDSKTLDGLNPHGALFDELHAWPSRDLWDIIDSGKGARRQPLIFQISTEGEDMDSHQDGAKKSIFNEQMDLVKRFLEDKYLADTACANYFGIIYTIDEGDDPMEEASWYKANPELGRAKSVKTMRDDAEKAKLSPGKMRDFLIKQLNIRPEKGASGWLAMDKWDACAGEQLTQSQVLERVAGKPVFCGFDASRTQDHSAVAIVWIEGDSACCAWLYFTPEDSLREREISDRAPYAEWVCQGWMATTAGNAIDYREIVSAAIKLLSKAQAEALWYDMSHGHEIAMQVRDELGMHGSIDYEIEGRKFTWHQVSAMAQTPANYAKPYREIEKRVIAGTLSHFGNPVARWNVQNAVAFVGPSENVMLNKGRTKGRIDGAVALGMAFAAMVTMPDGNKKPELGMVFS